MLADSVAKVRRLGTSFVNPSVYLRPMAQQISKRPATKRINQADALDMVAPYQEPSFRILVRFSSSGGAKAKVQKHVQMVEAGGVEPPSVSDQNQGDYMLSRCFKGDMRASIDKLTRIPPPEFLSAHTWRKHVCT